VVKQDPKQAKNLASLVKKLVTRFKPEEPPATDPVAQLVLSFLNWNTSTRKAEDAYDALLTEFVDINELRVSSVDQILDIIGEDYPEARPRIVRMKQSLHEVFVREHALSFASAQAQGKKEQRVYLDTLPGITPYVAAQVMLVSFNGHALPVDEKLLMLLEREGCIDAGLACADAEAVLLRQVKAADALRAHLALQAWSDASRLVPPPTSAQPVVTRVATPIEPKPAAPRKTPPAGKPTGAPSKVAKKTTTKKNTTKKTTTRKTTRRKKVAKKK